jgi:type IV secretory pathway VirB9-like protein
VSDVFIFKDEAVQKVSLEDESTKSVTSPKTVLHNYNNMRTTYPA